jgi:uncharacterized RDD family membrane protein YckC
LSTSYSQPNLEPVWKQEVNRRLAAHRSRNGASSAGPAAPAEAFHEVSSRAAQAAARVAARYAKAPSFSQMQAVEAQTAVRNAEIATQVALEAQAVAHAALANLEAASNEIPVRAREPFLAPPPAMRREPDMPQRREIPAAAGAPRSAASAKTPTVDWQQLESLGHGLSPAEEPELVEPGQPIHANLIEFPRELVAPRKARPRSVEGPYALAEEPAAQLSIFEVDPGAISPEAAPQARLAQPETFEWSGIELEAQPVEELEPDLQPAPAPADVHLAPFSRRLLAAVVDGALISGAFLAAAFTAATSMEHLPEAKLLEAGAVAALLGTGLLYETLFSTLTEATPGMRYAGISLCTFDDQIPTLWQRCSRLGSMVLSLLPLGLGVAWAIFDEEHLSWHDRLSKTYQRKS